MVFVLTAKSSGPRLNGICPQYRVSGIGGIVKKQSVFFLLELLEAYACCAFSTPMTASSFWMLLLSV